MIAELYGCAWADLESWAGRCSPDGCVICRSGRPYGILGELAHTWVTTDPEVAIFGYVCVICKRHAVEPFHLSDAEQMQFFGEAMAVSEALTTTSSNW